jgi:predicted DNA-binding ribbon-helix-helix protein
VGRLPASGKPAIIGIDLELEPPMTAKKTPAPREVERIQTGVRLEKRLLKVLKGLAEYLDLSLGDLLEGIALHALENKPPFKRSTLEKIAQLRRVYGFDLVATDSHRLREQDGGG